MKDAVSQHESVRSSMQSSLTKYTTTPTGIVTDRQSPTRTDPSYLSPPLYPANNCDTSNNTANCVQLLICVFLQIAHFEFCLCVFRLSDGEVILYYYPKIVVFLFTIKALWLNSFVYLCTTKSPIVRQIDNGLLSQSV